MWTLLSTALIVSVLIEATLQQPQSERLFHRKSEHLRKCSYTCGDETVGTEQMTQPGYNAIIYYNYGSEDDEDIVTYAASVIGYRHLLTVAQPLLRRRHSDEPLGPGNGQTGGITIAIYGLLAIVHVESITLSPTFSADRNERNDYALLKLNTRVEHLRRYCLPPANFDIHSLAKDNPIRQLSFSREEKPDGQELEQHEVRHIEGKVEIFSINHCTSFLSRWKYGKQLICAGCTEHWSGPCAVTAGAPLAYTNHAAMKVQVGLTHSYMDVQKKSSRYYSYIKVDGAFREWIIAEVREGQDEVCHAL